MKVTDLMDQGKLALAKQTGRNLAKMYHQGGYKPPHFKDFLSRGPLVELKSPDEVSVLQHSLDTLFKSLGIHVEFTQHFIERLMGRESRVTIKEIMSSFQKMKAKYFRQLQAAKNEHELSAVVKDFSRDLNIVFSLKGNEMDAITIMKKNPQQFVPNDFKTVEFRV